MEGFMQLLKLVTALGGAVLGNPGATTMEMALEEIALKALELHHAETGQPLDMSKLSLQERIE